MLEIAEDDGLVRIRASGTLAGSDFDRFVPVFESVSGRKPGRIPMIIELASDFSGWDVGGLLRDLKFDARHHDAFGRMAIVGLKEWEKWGTNLIASLFPFGEMEFFELADMHEAEAWARNKSRGRKS
ncbi:STAS/SEC14 domain-containing protein [Erythrobacter sp. LQ02-29]|uniref:STAS/SEC14 domain-containing protein n=1 Tax=Erythrobacteraceae TaxID=335929 RepID=UPI000DC6DD6B|nr:MULTISPECIES: STAS/SEC14 domain-containing protein [Erythrobacteraceae]MCP9223867.1 STAS/SEC14 domain-containing protein [Erythrobacter sp. LQ02-29]BBC71649.1 universal stress protein UspA [Altererythrobacter sp. B11]